MIRLNHFWSHYTAKDVGTTQNGKAELNKIIGKPVGFDTVKPLNIMKKILSLFKDRAIVLDFFAGFRVIIVIEANSYVNTRS